MIKFAKSAVIGLSKEEDDRLVEAHLVLRRLAADMRAFANGEPLANRLVRVFGYDANKIASALLSYSNNIFTASEHKAKACQLVVGSSLHAPALTDSGQDNAAAAVDAPRVGYISF